MSEIKERIEQLGLEQVRTNTNYSCGFLVNAADVVSDFGASPWLRSTTSINLYSKDAWAERVKASVVGFAVVYRSPEGADYRTVLNPKSSWSGVAGNTGKTASLDSSMTPGELIESELNFAAGRTILPTIIAGRTSRMPVGGTVSPEASAVPMAGQIGESKPQPDGMVRTSQGTNNGTGTAMVPPGQIKNQMIPNKTFIFRFGGL